MLARFERHPGRTFAAIGVLFAVLYVAALAAQPNRQRYVDGDAIQYYAYLRSLVFDRDLDFSNDYVALYGAGPESSGWLREQTPAGRPRNMMSIGPAILWSPFYLAVVAAGAVAARLGVPVTIDGFAPPFPIAAGVAGIAWATIGAYVCYRTAALRFSQRSAFWGSLLAWLASPALYYSLISPAYSHATSIATGAIVVYAWLRSIGDDRLSRWALLGVLTGVAMLVRWHAVILLALPGLELLSSFRRRPTGRTILAGVVLGAIAALAFVPQLLAWKAIYGQYVVIPQGPGFMRWTQPEFLAVLFSTRRGLFLWTPALLLAVAGLVLLVRRDRLLGFGAIVVLALSLYVNSAARDWWAGEAFGARRFVGETVLFALGFAALGSVLAAARVRAGWLRAAAVALVVYNGLFLVQYQLFMRGYRDLVPYPTTVRQILVDRVTLPFTLVRHWLDD